MNNRALALPWATNETTTDWIMDADGCIAAEVAEAFVDGVDVTDKRREFVIRACNAHDDLVKALDDLLCLEGLSHIDTGEEDVREMFAAARAALAKAGIHE